MDHKAPVEAIKFKSVMVGTDGSEKSRESFDVIINEKNINNAEAVAKTFLIIKKIII